MKQKPNLQSEKDRILSNLSKLIEGYGKKTFTLNRQYLLEELPVVMTAFEQGLLFESVLPNRSSSAKSKGEKPTVFLVYPKDIEPIFKEVHQLLATKLKNAPFTTKFIEVDIEAWEENGVEECRAHIPREEQLRNLLEANDKCCVFLTSLGKNYHEGAHLEATLNLFEKIIKTQEDVIADLPDDDETQKHKDDKWHIRVVLGDTLQAYNFSSDILTDEECDEYRKLDSQEAQNAYLKSKLPELKKRWAKKGDEWLCDAIPKYQHLASHHVDVLPKAKQADETNQSWLARASTKCHRWSAILAKAKSHYHFTSLRDALYKHYWDQRKLFSRITRDSHSILQKTVKKCLSKDKKKQNSPSQQFDKLVSVAVAEQRSRDRYASDDNDSIDPKTDLNIFTKFETMVLAYSQRQHENTASFLPSKPSDKKTKMAIYAYSNKKSSPEATELERKLLKRYLKKQASPNTKDTLEREILSSDPHQCVIANQPKFLCEKTIARPLIDDRIARHLDLNDNDNSNKVSVLFGPKELGKKTSILAHTQRHRNDYHLIAWFNCKQLFTILETFSSISRGFELALDDINQPKRISKKQHKQHLIEDIEHADKPSCLIFYDVETFHNLKPYLPKKNCHIFITKNEHIPDDEQQEIFASSTNYIEVLRPTPNQMHTLCREIIGIHIDQKHIETLCHAFQQNPKMIALISLFLKKQLSQDYNNTQEVVESMLQQFIHYFYPTQSSQSSSATRPSVELFTKILDYILGDQCKKKQKREKAEDILSIASLLYTDNLPLAFLETTFNKKHPKETGHQPHLFSSIIKLLQETHLLLSNANGIAVMLDCFTDVIHQKMQDRDVFKSILLNVTRNLIEYILDKDPGLINETLRDEMYPHLRLLLTHFDSNENHVILGDLYYLLAIYESQSNSSLSNEWVEKAYDIYADHNRGLQTPRLHLLVHLMLLRRLQYYASHSYPKMNAKAKGFIRLFIEQVKNSLDAFYIYLDRESPESVFASRILKESINHPDKILFVLDHFIFPHDPSRRNNSFILIEKNLFTGEDVRDEAEFSYAATEGMTRVGPDLPKAKQCQEKARKALSRMKNVTILDKIYMAQLDTIIALTDGRLEDAKKHCETVLLPFAQKYEGNYPILTQTCYLYSAFVASCANDISAIYYSAESLRLLKKTNTGENRTIVTSHTQMHNGIIAQFGEDTNRSAQYLEEARKTVQQNQRDAQQYFIDSSNESQSNLVPNRENLPLRKFLGLTTTTEECFSAVRRNDHINLDKFLNSTDDNSIDVNMIDDETGDTLLHCATRNAATNCIQYLLENNCYTLTVNHENQTAFQLIPENQMGIKKIFIAHWLQKAKEYFQHGTKHPLGQSLIANALQACRELNLKPESGLESEVAEQVEDLFLDYSLVLFEQENAPLANTSQPNIIRQHYPGQSVFSQPPPNHEKDEKKHETNYKNTY